jgi:hypothetical protein
MNTGTFIIELLGMAAIGRPFSCVSCKGRQRHFVKRLDGDAIPDESWLEFTHDYTEVLRFHCGPTAVAGYLAQSRSIPVNPWDERPNRPLTAFTVEFVREDLLSEEPE